MPLDAKLERKLRALEGQAEELSGRLADPGSTSDLGRYREMTRAYSELQPIIERFTQYRQVVQQQRDAEELLDGSEDPEMRRLASDELKQLQARLGELEEELRLVLLPRDPNDAKNVVLEVRAGTGGDEASLFAGEIYEMYRRYAESQGWTVRETYRSPSAVGGVKEAIAVVEGDRVYSRMKFESGVHRVQRVPETEAQGRIHTSAVTVAVLPEVDEVELVIDEKDLRIDTFCSSGPGGQSVNTTKSAIRITHLPTNLVVQCQDEKSQHKNKSRAMQVLRSRLYDLKQQAQHDEIARERSGMIGSGDRSEKIRTYNFPQSRVTDHRIGITVHNLSEVMKGDLGSLVDALVSHDQAERLKDEVRN